MLSQPLTFTARPMGDRAWLVRLFTQTDNEPSRKAEAKYARLLAARHLTRYLDQATTKPPALTQAELVAGYDSVLVTFDPTVIATSAVKNWLEQAVAAFITLYNRDPAAATAQVSTIPTHHHIPVVYGGEYGLDLNNVAHLNQLTTPEVIQLHTGQTYEVYFVGFAPGFAYLGPLPIGLDAPRLSSPRPKVKAGSVALAAGLTAIYPFTSPGGWQLIGYTPTPVFLPQSEPPVLFQPGDKVSFYPISTF